MCNTYIDYTVQLLIEDYICSKLIAQYFIIFMHKNIDVCDIITVLNIKSLKLYPVTKTRSVIANHSDGKIAFLTIIFCFVIISDIISNNSLIVSLFMQK